MLKKIILILFLIVFSKMPTFSKEVPVIIVPVKEISTSDTKLQEGNFVDFVVAKDIYSDSKLLLQKGTVATGIITSLQENEFNCQEASVYIENFKVKTAEGKIIKLNGIVYKKGHTHWMFTQVFVALYPFIRGGEVKILPQEEFTLYLGV